MQLYASIQLATVNAETVAVITKLHDDDITFDNVISCLTDSAVYMSGVDNGLHRKMEYECTNLLVINFDICHHVHNCVK